MSISDADKLSLYNGALLFIGERKLILLTENVEPRRLLDDVWDRGAVDTVLEHGQWNFATRSSKFEYNPSMIPAFGYNRVFEKPSDFIKTCAVCSDEYFQIPLLQHLDEAGFWFASLDDIYVRYVSNDGEYGTDISLWPPSFRAYFEAWLGCQIIYKITHSDSEETAKKKERDKLKITAKSQDAMNEPTKFTPSGRFRAARGRGRGGAHDGGVRGRLLG